MWIVYVMKRNPAPNECGMWAAQREFGRKREAEIFISQLKDIWNAFYPDKQNPYIYTTVKSMIGGCD